jgi:hypothetical protein
VEILEEKLSDLFRRESSVICLDFMIALSSCLECPGLVSSCPITSKDRSRDVNISRRSSTESRNLWQIVDSSIPSPWARSQVRFMHSGLYKLKLMVQRIGMSLLDHQFDHQCLDDNFDLAQYGFELWALATGVGAQE